MSLWTPLVWLALISPLLLLAKLLTKKTNPKYLFLFAAYFLAYAYARLLGFEYLNLKFLNLDLNWGGTILSLLLALLFLWYHAKTIRQNMGFTTKVNKETVKLGVLIFFGILIFDFGFKMLLFPKGGHFEMEQFLFQASMPGLSEEIVYRGILLWILSKAFVPTKKIKGVVFGWGFVIVTFLFAMIHGVMLTETMEFKIDIVTIIYLTLVTSLSLGILRKFSGNLVLPTLGHNLVNLMNFFIRLL